MSKFWLSVLFGVCGLSIGFAGCDRSSQAQPAATRPVATVYYIGTTQSSNAYEKEEVTEVRRGYQGIYISFKKSDGEWVTTNHYTIHWHGEVAPEW